MDTGEIVKSDLETLQDKVVDFGAQFANFAPEVVKMSDELVRLHAAVRAHWLFDAAMVSGTICELCGIRYGVFPAAQESDETGPGYYLCRIGDETEIMRHFKLSEIDTLVAAARTLAPLHEWSGFNPRLL